ncbi:hypothetical protein AAMO2058_001187300, partial [Amorphochlora amoebiformis]
REEEEKNRAEAEEARKAEEERARIEKAAAEKRARVEAVRKAKEKAEKARLAAVKAKRDAEKARVAAAKKAKEEEIARKKAEQERIRAEQEFIRQAKAKRAKIAEEERLRRVEAIEAAEAAKREETKKQEEERKQSKANAQKEARRALELARARERAEKDEEERKKREQIKGQKQVESNLSPRKDNSLGLGSIRSLRSNLSGDSVFHNPKESKNEMEKEGEPVQRSSRANTLSPGVKINISEANAQDRKRVAISAPSIDSGGLSVDPDDYYEQYRRNSNLADGFSNMADFFEGHDDEDRGALFDGADVTFGFGIDDEEDERSHRRPAAISAMVNHSRNNTQTGKRPDMAVLMARARTLPINTVNKIGQLNHNTRTADQLSPTDLLELRKRGLSTGDLAALDDMDEDEKKKCVVS